ncbi:MAG: hypothetical protein GX557_06685 [Chloroflexi bacterium]|nr:hypothetical protein [Chloroflexota bacterium]
MPIVVGVKFRGSSKLYYFSPDQTEDLAVNDHVIVDTARGLEMGQVAMAPQDVSEDKIVGQLKPVVRKATAADLVNTQRYQAKEADALAKCREQVARSNLPMKVVQAEFSYDGSHLTFHFTSEQRVDFRDLVRELAHQFRTRIELRQIGVRDEARIVGGIGKCGRPLCCATWLSDFAPVSIRMAKQQDLPLSPMEISGLCGRLLCCLAYETDYYQAVKGQFPKVGKTIDTPVGPARVIKIRVFKETADVLLENGTILELNADQVAGREPIVIEPKNGALNGLQQQALGQAIDDEGDDEDEALDERPRSRPTPAAPRTPAASEPRAAGRPTENAEPKSGARRPEGGQRRSEGGSGRRGDGGQPRSGQPGARPPASGPQQRDKPEGQGGSAQSREGGSRSSGRRRRRSSRGGQQSGGGGGGNANPPSGGEQSGGEGGDSAER